MNIKDFQFYVRDSLQHIDLMKSRHPDLPVFIVGHSMVKHFPLSVEQVQYLGWDNIISLVNSAALTVIESCLPVLSSAALHCILWVSSAQSWRSGQEIKLSDISAKGVFESLTFKWEKWHTALFSHEVVLFPQITTGHSAQSEMVPLLRDNNNIYQAVKLLALKESAVWYHQTLYTLILMTLLRFFLVVALNICMMNHLLWEQFREHLPCWLFWEGCCSPSAQWHRLWTASRAVTGSVTFIMEGTVAAVFVGREKNLCFSSWFRGLCNISWNPQPTFSISDCVCYHSPLSSIHEDLSMFDSHRN